MNPLQKPQSRKFAVRSFVRIWCLSLITGAAWGQQPEVIIDAQVRARRLSELEQSCRVRVLIAQSHSASRCQPLSGRIASRKRSKNRAVTRKRSRYTRN